MTRNLGVSSLMVVALTGAWLAFTNAEAQSTKPPLQPLQLPDPTPRPQDPHDVFSNDPIAAARQQQGERAKLAHQREMLVADAAELYLLAKHLQDQVEHTEAAAMGEPGVMTAQKIEKIAKRMKDRVKGQ